MSRNSYLLLPVPGNSASRLVPPPNDVGAASPFGGIMMSVLTARPTGHVQPGTTNRAVAATNSAPYSPVGATRKVRNRAMRTLNVLSLTRISAEDRAKIEAVDPAVRLTDAGGWFDGEYRETWPAFSANRYLAPNAAGKGTREERDRLLADAEIILGGR